MYFKGLVLISVQQPVFLHCVTITHLQKAEKNYLQFIPILEGIKWYKC